MERLMKRLWVGGVLVLGCHFQVLAGAAARDHEVYATHSMDILQLSEEVGYPIQARELHGFKDRDLNFLRKNLEALQELRESCLLNPDALDMYTWTVRGDCAPCGWAIKKIDARLNKISRRFSVRHVPIWDDAQGEDWKETGEKMKNTVEEFQPSHTSVHWDATIGAAWFVAGKTIGTMGHDPFKKVFPVENTYDPEKNPVIASPLFFMTFGLIQAINGKPVQDFLSSISNNCGVGVGHWDSVSIINRTARDGACEVRVSGLMKKTSTSKTEDKTTEEETVKRIEHECVIDLPCDQLEIGFITVPKDDSESP